jgi:hypothetical protein
MSWIPLEDISREFIASASVKLIKLSPLVSTHSSIRAYRKEVSGMATMESCEWTLIIPTIRMIEKSPERFMKFWFRINSSLVFIIIGKNEK